jgi:MFS family permease
VNKRLVTLIVGSSLASTGVGAFMPYLYTDIATTRHLGGAVAAITFTAFALGSLLATPFAGRLADGPRPVLVASSSRALMGVGLLALGFTQTAWTIWLASALTGIAFALTQPAVGVLLLAWTPEGRTRQAFAWQFIGMNLALALGGFASGLFVDLSTPSGTLPIYLLAGAAAFASASVVALAGHGATITNVRGEVADADAKFGLLALLRVRPVRWLLGVTVLLMLACYAQYDSGLPAYALGALKVDPSILGTSVALNAILVAILTVPVVALTRKYAPTTLLACCGVLWVGCWLIFATPLVVSGSGVASGAVLLGYASISFGETMLAPVLSPFAASIAPAGAVGRTLGAVNGATTLANAIGPALSGVLLALGVPAAFIALQLACCLGAVALAVRLGRLTGGSRRHRRSPALARTWDLAVADDLVLTG